MLTKYLTLIVAGLLTVVATGCIVSVEPERAVNPVGTDHTVTVEFRDPSELNEDLLCKIFLDIYEEVFEDEFPGQECYITGTTDVVEYVRFEILSGPNAGRNSLDDGVCEPACTEPTKDFVYSWTYESNGLPGTDVIQVCIEAMMQTPFLLGAAESEQEEFERLILDAVNDVLDTDYESIFEFECGRVEKTWVAPEERRPNIGAGLSGLFQGQPTPLPTAAAPAPSPVIRPPSTGDAGIK